MLQAKYGLNDNFMIEGRYLLGTAFSNIHSASVRAAIGLVTYNFGTSVEKLFPYIGIGVAAWSPTNSTSIDVPWSAVGDVGINYYIMDQLAISVDVLIAAAGSVAGTGHSLGVNYTF